MFVIFNRHIAISLKGMPNLRFWNIYETLLPDARTVIISSTWLFKSIGDIVTVLMDLILTKEAGEYSHLYK